MEATYNNNGSNIFKYAALLLVLGALVAFVLMSITEANLSPDVNPGNFNQCIEEDILMCWDNYDPVKKADIKYVRGRYEIDFFEIVRDEWQLVSTVDDIATIEEVGSFLQARGFVIMWP